MENQKEVTQMKNRFRELAERSFRQGVFTFTGFLGLGEMDVFWQQESELAYAGFCMDGGYPEADRCVIRFGKEEELGYSVPFPICCIRIAPVAMKFADRLSHRDFLGALMNLGIERSTLGDIKIGEKCGFLFCLESIAPFLCEHLTQVKHTTVTCRVIESLEEYPKEEPEQLTIQVQSLRVDAVIAKVFNLSREKSIELFRSGKVFVAGRLCENNSRILKQGEIVSVRGYGKLMLTEEARETRKGKLSVQAAVFR
ncbi:MAG: YlmH/Sll1252 family protein [Acetatifactor sp.]